MTKDIEVEVRGRLTSAQYQSLESFLRENGKYLETKDRITLDYSTFLPGEGVRGRTRDIRLRVTNKQPEIITKLGVWGGRESRKELSVKTPPGTFDTLVQNYAALGYTKAALFVRRTEVFTYADIEFALVEVPQHSYYFEAEKMVGESETDAAHAELEKVCETLGLTLFDDEGLHSYIEELNREANEVFDYTDYEDGYFAKRFSL